jgi:hypothetical protein
MLPCFNLFNKLERNSLNNPMCDAGALPKPIKNDYWLGLGVGLPKPIRNDYCDGWDKKANKDSVVIIVLKLL